MDAALVTLDGADHELLCHEVTMAVGEVVDSDYCFDRALTISEETSTVVRRDVCNYVYERGFICIQCELAYPAPVEVCVTKDITITEVICEDLVENKCFNVAKFVDATNTVDQKEIIIGEPSCEEITLTLDTQACQQQHVAHVAHAVPVVHHASHHAVHHSAPIYHG